jgi:hypothetical protein
MTKRPSWAIRPVRVTQLAARPAFTKNVRANKGRAPRSGQTRGQVTLYRRGGN